MGQEEFDKVLLKTGPSRLLSAHLYLLALAFLGGAISSTLSMVPLPEGQVFSLDTKFLVPAALASLSFIMTIYAEIKRLTKRYIITENRVALREGILSKRIQYMPYSKVERVELRQSVLGRLFRIGNVLIDTGEDTINLRAVKRPDKVERLVSERLTQKGGS